MKRRREGFGVRRLVAAFHSADLSAQLLELVIYREVVRLKAIDRFDGRRRRRSFEPSRGTPGILISH